MGLSSDGDSPLAIFRTTVESFFGMIKASPFAAKMFVLMENAQHLDILPPELKEMLLEADRLIENSASLIERGQELGEIKAGNPEALAVAFWCSIQGIAQRIALYPETPCPNVEWIVSILEAKRNGSNV